MTQTSWEIMGDGPEPFVGEPGIFGAEIRAASAPDRPVPHSELMQYARLIASAPDMLAALRMAHHALEGRERKDVALDAVAAAIARATS